MAAKKTAATKTAPVQTEEIVKVEETVKVEKKPAAKKATKAKAEKEVKEAFVAAGNKETDVKEIAVYVKPEESAIYYVVNGDVTGRVDF